MKIVSSILFVVFVSACSPYIEKVEFYEYVKKYPNRFRIIINTRDDLFEGRESFLSFKRKDYTFYSDKRAYEYSEKDLLMLVYNFEKRKTDSVYLKSAKFIITKFNSKNIGVEVCIDDSLIPKMVNGIYKLKLVDKDSTGYKMFRYEN